MVAVLKCALAAAVLARQAAADWDPRAPGPFDADKGITFKLCAAGRAKGWEAFVVAPTAAEPTVVPAVAFLPGFSAKPGMYTQLHGHVASHGIATVGLNVPTLRRAVEGIEGRAEDSRALLECIVQDGGADFHARYRAAGGNANITFDLVNQLGLVSHSIGGHTLLHILDKMSCFNAKFVVTFDPVDGLDPYGFEKQFLLPEGINPGLRLNFSTPFALVTSGYANDAVPFPKILHWPSCAPVNRSGYHWYTSLQSPKWMLNFTEFGHVDLLDDIYPRKVTDIICPEGPGAATVEGRASYRARLGAVVVSLGQAVLPAVPKSPKLPQAAYLKWLNTASAMEPLKVTVESDEGGGPVTGHCARHDQGEAATLVV